MDTIYFFLFSTETVSKFKMLKKGAHLVLMNSLEKAVWNWMEHYPSEFADLQVQAIMSFKKDLIIYIHLFSN